MKYLRIFAVWLLVAGCVHAAGYGVGSGYGSYAASAGGGGGGTNYVTNVPAALILTNTVNATNALDAQPFASIVATNSLGTVAFSDNLNTLGNITNTLTLSTWTNNILVSLLGKGSFATNIYTPGNSLTIANSSEPDFNGIFAGPPGNAWYRGDFIFLHNYGYDGGQYIAINASVGFIYLFHATTVGDPWVSPYFDSGDKVLTGSGTALSFHEFHSATDATDFTNSEGFIISDLGAGDYPCVLRSRYDYGTFISSNTTLTGTWPDATDINITHLDIPSGISAAGAYLRAGDYWVRDTYWRVDASGNVFFNPTGAGDWSSSFGIAWNGSSTPAGSLTPANTYFIWNNSGSGEGAYPWSDSAGRYQKDDGWYLDLDAGTVNDPDGNAYGPGLASISHLLPTDEGATLSTYASEGPYHLGKVYRLDTTTPPDAGSWTIFTNTEYVARHVFKFSSNIVATNSGFSAGTLPLTTSTNTVGDAVLLVPSTGGTMDAHVLKNTKH
jgi:hypothetical protein